jgi:mRNA interferase MazF
MVNKTYTPERGDLVWLDFNPQLGHEQRERRPALTVSFKAYNEKIGLALFCPITSKIKAYPFEVAIEGKTIKGAVLCDQVKSLDWRERNVEFIEKIDDVEMEKVIEKIEVLIR